MCLSGFSPSTRVHRPSIGRTNVKLRLRFHSVWVQALCRFFKNLVSIYFRTEYLPRCQPTLQLCFIQCFPCLAFFKSFALSFQTFPCLIKLFVDDNTYRIFAFFKTFLAFSFCLRFRSSFFVLLFLDLRENWSKLVKTLQTVNEDWRRANNNLNALRSDWFILIADFWLDKILFPRLCERVVSPLRLEEFRLRFPCNRFYPKISLIWKKKTKLQHGKCFVRCLPTSYWLIRKRTEIGFFSREPRNFTKFAMEML